MIPSMQVSHEAQALGQEIAGLVRERRMQRPDLQWNEVLLALAVARETLEQEAGPSASRAALVAGLAALALAAAGALVFFQMGG